MRRMASTLCAALALTFASACGGPEAYTVRDSRGGQMQVLVENNNWMQVVVRAVSAGEQHRLGEVNTAQRRRFVLPRTVSPMGIRFLIDPIGSRESYLSPTVTPRDGAVITLTVANNLDLSHLEVR